MNKRTGQLNQPFVECAIRAMPVGQPEFLEHIVRFVIKLPVEAVEVGQVARVPFAAAKLLREFRDVLAFFAHKTGRNPKFKAVGQVQQSAGLGTETRTGDDPIPPRPFRQALWTRLRREWRRPAGGRNRATHGCKSRRGAASAGDELRAPETCR